MKRKKYVKFADARTRVRVSYSEPFRTESVLFGKRNEQTSVETVNSLFVVSIRDVVQEYIAGVLICITTRSWLVSFASNLKLKK
jgi:hypothetical protein